MQVAAPPKGSISVGWLWVSFLNRNSQSLDGAGVDLLGLVQVFQLAGLFQVLGADGGQVHEADGLVAAGVELAAQVQIVVPGLFHQGVVDGHLVQNGAEGGVTAVVGPVGVDHADLGDGGITLLLGEILLAEGDVVQIHGQAIVGDELGQLLPAQTNKAGEGLHGGGDGIFHRQSGLFGQIGLAGLHRVDDVFFHRFQLLGGDIALQQVEAGAAHHRALALADELDALAGGIGPLVKLAGQVLHREHGPFPLGQGKGGVVGLGLAEDSGHAAVKQLLANALHVIAVEQPQAGNGIDLQQAAQFPQQGLGLAVKAGLALYIYAINHRDTLLFWCDYCLAARARLPMSLRRCSPSKLILSAAA